MRTGENVAPPHLVAAYNLDSFKLIQISTAETKYMDLHWWGYDRSLLFQRVAYQDPWCHDTAVLIVEVMSCKPLVSQKTVTWKKERKSFTNKNSQPSCACIPSMHSTTEAKKSKVALNHQQGKASAQHGKISQHSRSHHQTGRLKIHAAHGGEIGQICFSTPVFSQLGSHELICA